MPNVISPSWKPFGHRETIQPGVTMCGRTATVATYRQYYESFLVSDEPPEGSLERYNLPFSYYGKKADPDSIIWEYLPTIRSAEGKRVFDMMSWKLIPHWAQGKLPEYTSHNCRVKAGEDFSKAINNKATFRSAWNNNQRCLIPVSWFYEWSSHTKPKQPYMVKDINEPFLSLAGIWDISTTQQGISKTSCAILQPKRMN